ncbi:MAG: N-acetylmuramoyl-L-alanine amidase [Bacteroidaceae bacterium]|nr:N-acetylmuramoyl-L-alanine amidase [Bacteroidaceae bacterium]
MATVYKIGSPKSDEVAQIQRALHLIPDGIFGKITREAVIAFQKENGLNPVDGIVGPATLAKLFPKDETSSFSIKKIKRRITDIIIHCTATPEGQAKSIAKITQEHKNRGFNTIGYHYVIMLDGTIALGRDADIIGAHCSGYNAHSIGVSYVGGLENKPGVPYKKLKAKDTRTEAQKSALRNLLMLLKKAYPNAVIKGHRDYSPDKNGDGLIEPSEWIKSCPSFSAITEYKDL